MGRGLVGGLLNDDGLVVRRLNLMVVGFGQVQTPATLNSILKAANGRAFCLC